MLKDNYTLSSEQTLDLENCITTGSLRLDALLGGGIKVGKITEFFGQSEVGKTRLAHQLCVNVQLPKKEGGLNGNALYLDTENTFRPERIVEMAEALELASERVLKNITIQCTYSSELQMRIFKYLPFLICYQ
ncbi:MAG: hypothetical protein ACTSO9_16980 [Candidatus Helarchaeota archaeon]